MIAEVDVQARHDEVLTRIRLANVLDDEYLYLGVLSDELCWVLGHPYCSRKQWRTQ